MNIGIYIYELAEELDWAGPWEVLGAWSDRADDVHVFTITDTDRPVRCAKGLRVLGDHTWETPPELDVLVLPGGDSRGPVADEALIGRVRALRERGALGVDVRDERFVDAGEVITAAGVSAGIDMALHLVARLDSVERARDVRRYIQYDPDPPV